MSNFLPRFANLGRTHEIPIALSLKRPRSTFFDLMVTPPKNQGVVSQGLQNFLVIVTARSI
jgi:hypothetical protein